MAATPELSQAAANQRNTEETILEGIVAETAFLVYKTKEGQWVVSLDINVPITMEKDATIPDVKQGTQTVSADISNQETANYVVAIMQMQARQAMEQRMNQQIMQNLPQGLAG